MTYKLLEFQSLSDCLAFADDFVRLNPKSSLVQSSRNDDIVCNDQSIHGSQEQNGSNVVPVVGDAGHREVVSWMTKMLHDKCFLSYIDKIEKYLTETQDGMQILQGLEQGELSSA